jgi:uncharacterized membrane protein
LFSDHFFEVEQHPGEITTLVVKDVGVFYQYLPTIAGVTLGQLLHLGMVPTLYLGRLFSLIVYILLLTLAIRLAPARFKTLFVLLGLVPLTLASAGTFSYDNVLTELAFVFLAYVLRLAFEEQHVRVRDMVLISIIAVLIIPLKHVYFPLLFLVLLIPAAKWPRPYVKALWCAGASVCILAITGAFASGHLAYDATQTLQNQQANALPAEPQNYTIGSFFANTLSGVIIYLRSLLHDLGLFADLPTGFAFAEKLPVWFYYLLFVLLILSAAPSDDQKTALSGDQKTAIANNNHIELSITAGQRLVLGVIALIIYGLVVASGITSTPQGNQLIAGVQGRYMIPIVPLVVLALSGWLRTPFAASRVFLYLFCCIDALGIFLQFMAVA